MSYMYCLDTSGFSNPLMDMPDDIHVSLWTQVMASITSDRVCWNGEIAEELKSIYGNVGACLNGQKRTCCLEVGDDDWDWESYLVTYEQWQVTYTPFISEHNGGKKNTIGLNDLSIVALAKTMGLPLISMEKRNLNQPSTNKLKIPNLCDVVGVQHLDFNDFLRAEEISA
jgi:hypothetical protein